MKNRDGGEVNDNWATPAWLYKELDAEFHFDFDPCPLNSKFDGLVVPWGKSNFINPPYNRNDKPRFIQKAFKEWRRGATCVLLIPAAVSTKDFHDLIYPHAEIRFLRGRVAFLGTNSKGEKVTTKKGKHDSMIVIFRGKSHSVSLARSKDTERLDIEEGEGREEGSVKHRWREAIDGRPFPNPNWVRCEKCGDETTRSQAKRGWNPCRPDGGKFK